MTATRESGAAAQSGRFDGPLTRRIVDVLVGFFLVAGALAPSGAMAEGFVFPDDVDLVTCLVSSALAVVLPWRRHWPKSVFLITLVVSIVMAASGHSIYGYTLALAIAVYEIARRGERAVTIQVALTSVIALGSTVFVDPAGDQHFLRLVGLAATIGFGAAVGDSRHSRRSYVDSLNERVRLAEETREQEAQRRVAEERMRIARELHDAAAHQIAVINLQAGAASAALKSNRKDDAQAALSTIRESAQGVLSEISALLHVLRTEGEEDRLRPTRGLADVENLITEFERSGLHVQFDAPPAFPQVPEEVDVVAYKVIQEALTNAHKHGLDHKARLELKGEGESLRILVSNARTRRLELGSSGHGLTGMKERVDIVGGEVHVDTHSRSFILDVQIPLKRTVRD